MTGRVGTGTGYNAYPLRSSAAPYFAFAKSVKATGRRGTLAVTQQHWSMEGRAVVREGTLETFKENPSFAKAMGLDEELPKGGNPSLYTHPPLTAQEQWGMVIDLNTCTGCNACVVACQAENNSPIVGKEQVINGREMHWMRIDRYFASTDEERPRSRDGLPADALPAVRERPVRDRLPGERHRPYAGRVELHGLQPLHRHAVLREQLPVQGAPVQFLQLQRAPHHSADRSAPSTK